MLNAGTAAVDFPQEIHLDDDDIELIYYFGYRLLVSDPNDDGFAEVAIVPCYWWDDEFGDPVWEHMKPGMRSPWPAVRARLDVRSGALYPERNFDRALAKYDIAEIRAAAQKALLALAHAARQSHPQYAVRSNPSRRRRGRRARARRNPTDGHPDHEVWHPPGLYRTGPNSERERRFYELLWVSQADGVAYALGTNDEKPYDGSWWIEYGPAEYDETDAKYDEGGWRVGTPRKAIFFALPMDARALTDAALREIGLKHFDLVPTINAMLMRFQHHRALEPRKAGRRRTWRSR